MHSLIELSNPEYSVFGASPFASTGPLPLDVLQLAVSAVTRQSADGRLSQVVNGDTDGAALDGASAGVGVWLGALTDTKRASYFLTAAQAQLNYVGFLGYNIHAEFTHGPSAAVLGSPQQQWRDLDSRLPEAVLVRVLTPSC
jgi:hypothetical protein